MLVNPFNTRRGADTEHAEMVHQDTLDLFG